MNAQLWNRDDDEQAQALLEQQLRQAAQEWAEELARDEAARFEYDEWIAFTFRRQHEPQQSH